MREDLDVGLKAPRAGQGSAGICGFYLATVLAATLVMAPLVLRYAKWRYLWLAFFALSFLMLMLAWAAQRCSRPVGWLISLGMLNLLLVVPEFALRNSGFIYASGVQFGYPKPEHLLWYRPHEELFWTLRPSDAGVNAFGFPGGDVVIPKPTGTTRILFLGDSCTQQGYPDDVENLLAAPGKSSVAGVECVTLAIAGYSSHQGRVLAELYGRAMQPDAAFVFYGWNDHWPAYGTPDAAKRIHVPSGFLSRVKDMIDHVRLYQLVQLLGHRLRPPEATRPIDSVRVPREDYAANLRAIVSVFKAQHVPVVLITAPTSHYRFGVTEDLLDATQSASGEWVQAMHREYNDVVRQVAQREGVSVLDLEVASENASDPDLHALFLRDGIHFTPAGCHEVATRIADFIAETDLLRLP